MPIDLANAIVDLLQAANRATLDQVIERLVAQNPVLAEDLEVELHHANLNARLAKEFGDDPA